MKSVIRFTSAADLFFDQKVSNEINVMTNSTGGWHLRLKFEDGRFKGYLSNPAHKSTQNLMLDFDHRGDVGIARHESSVLYYRYTPSSTFPNTKPGSLNPPFGDNLVAVLYSDEKLRKRIGSVIRQQGFRLQLKPTENELFITKDVNDELYSYPWSTVSETLRRVVFFMAVLETNKDATLLLDEPEANTFPFYTKYLAERIALDESNQYFITTHTPSLRNDCRVAEAIKQRNPATRIGKFLLKVSLRKHKGRIESGPS